MPPIFQPLEPVSSTVFGLVSVVMMVGGVGAGFGGGGKSLMGTLGTSQHVVQRQQFTDETGGADSHIIRFGADETGDRFRGGDGLGVTGLAGAGVGTAGVPRSRP